MKKEVYISDLKVGQRIESSFAIRKKSLKFTSTSAPFLELELGDRSGRIQAVYWGADSLEINDDIKEGDVIYVSGNVASWHKRPRLKLDSLELERDYDPTDFLPVCAIPLDELWDAFIKAIEEIENEHFQSLFELILADEDMVRTLKVCPGGKKWHHAYLGGLLEHSLSVARIALTAGKSYPLADKSLLLTSALLHDIGKVREFTWTTYIDYSEEGRLLGHIVLGSLILEKYISRLPSFPEGLRKKLLHIVISHHGEFEYGSPVLPMTIEANIVYHADQMDAKCNAYSRIMKRAREQGRESWSEFVNLVNRYLYLK